MSGRRGRGVLRVALLFAALLASLAMVIWRQSRALDTLRSLDAVARERAVVEAEWARLVRRVETLEGRARVARLAGERLGMRLPVGQELVILPLRPQARYAGATAEPDARGGLRPGSPFRLTARAAQPAWLVDDRTAGSSGAQAARAAPARGADEG